MTIGMEARWAALSVPGRAAGSTGDTMSALMFWLMRFLLPDTWFCCDAFASVTTTSILSAVAAAFTPAA